MARKERSKAAYFLVDLTELDAETRKELIEDAQAGGGEYGLQVVEIVHNGPAQSPIYGVYNFNQEKWDAAKEEFGISSSDVADEEVHGGDPDNTDPRMQAAIHQAAAEEAQRIADKVNAGEAANVAEIVGADAVDTSKPKAKK